MTIKRIFMTPQDETEYKRVLAIIASLLVEYAAIGDRPIPRSTIYMACGMNLDHANTIERIMVDSELIETTSETIKLTNKGRGIARKLSEAL